LKHHPSSLNHHTSTTSTSGESLRLHHDDKPAHIKPQYENKLTKRSHTTTTTTTTTKMAGVRDPAFWKRFSVAVHMDEDQAEKQGPQHKDECVSLCPQLYTMNI
jgi:hypothetical protein